jgi:hypothetical protein
VYDHFSGVYKDRIDGNLFLFGRLHELGMMRTALLPGEYEMLAERMINFGDTWIYSSEVYRRISTNEYIDGQTITMLAMLYPYLTEKGISEYLKIS